MSLFTWFTLCYLLFGGSTLAQLPPDFPGDEEPYQVIPIGTVETENLFGTFLYGYKDCGKNFLGARDKINQAYYDAYTMSR